MKMYYSIAKINISDVLSKTCIYMNQAINGSLLKCIFSVACKDHIQCWNGGVSCAHGVQTVRLCRSNTEIT